MDVIHAGAREGEVDPCVIALDGCADRLRSINHADERAAAVRRAIRVGGDVRVVIGIEDKGRAVPGVEFRDGVQFKMTFAGVFGVETEDSLKDGAGRVERIEMAQIGVSGVDDFANDRGRAGVVAGGTGAGAIHRHVGMHIAVTGDVGVRKDVLPVRGVGGVLRVSQRRDSKRGGFPKPRHLRDLERVNVIAVVSSTSGVSRISPSSSSTANAAAHERITAKNERRPFMKLPTHSLVCLGQTAKKR